MELRDWWLGAEDRTEAGDDSVINGESEDEDDDENNNV